MANAAKGKRAVPMRWAIVLLLVSLLGPSGDALGADGAIPASEIAELRAALAEALSGRGSSVTQRRALKRIVRDGQSMVRGAVDAPNRFETLGIVFRGQKRLLDLEATERNRSELFDTAQVLSAAPDLYAEYRLDAELLLSEKRLTEGGATVEERATDLLAVVERYRGTPAEARSLMIASVIAQKLNVPELERAIQSAMDERCFDDVELIAFRRTRLQRTRIDVRFKGTFARLDGSPLSFPSDTLGHMCLVVFWSRDATNGEALMTRVRDYEEQYPGLFRVFSLNVDELPDAGQSVLSERGLDWTVLGLPSGRQHPAYRAYAQGDAVALLVNAYGFTVLKPEAHLDAVGWRSEKTDVFAISADRISKDRYLAQMQSLFSGDLLAGSVGGSAEIRECLVAPPYRYRLTGDAALTNYALALQRCEDARQEDMDPSTAAALSDLEILALLGKWKLSCEPVWFEQAVAVAEASLATRPSAPNVVARYCLAKAALRDHAEDAESVLASFHEACKASDSPALVHAAAGMLALHAGSRELHEKYRTLFLESHSADPALDAFAAFLRDPQHRFRLLTPNHTKHERYVRGYVVGFGGAPTTELLPRIELKRIDGRPLVLPESQAEKMTILLVMEPPGAPAENYPVVLDRHGRTNNQAGVRGMVHFAELLADKHIHQGIDVIAAFLTDDAERVTSLKEKNGWDFQVATVPGGVENLMVNRLGILSADRFPNVFLLRHDGSVAWRASGAVYRQFGHPWVHQLAMKVHIETSEVERGFELLQQGAFDEAVHTFAGPYLPWLPDRYGWRSVRYHGRALALMGVQNWEHALEAIDTSIDARKLRHFEGRRNKDILKWREDAATVDIAHPDETLAALLGTRDAILAALGRPGESGALREGPKNPVEDEKVDPYVDFHAKLDLLRPFCLSGKDSTR